ncbi:hypothetical protein MNBD_NITROSPIRAE02-216 [hydrothermal vent metagenome]|uniref:DUF3187 family protein n=1 Tax=hydrothermal vent metagenome TaxID=652676 RepID=A0A3B1D850_9ZZZZ
MRTNKKILIAVVLYLTSFFATAGTVRGFEGPLNIRNSFPLFLAIGNPSIISAEGEDSVDLNLMYSSTYLVNTSGEWTFNLDLEAAIIDFQIKRLFWGDSVEVSLDIPVLSFNSGFLDGFLEFYHSALGFPDYGRSNRPPNDFLFEVTHNGRTVVAGKSGEIALGDIKVGVKKALYVKDPYISIYGSIEFPTGEPESGYGNGALDTSVALLVNKGIGDSIMTYFNAGAVFTDSFRGEETIDLEDYLYGAAGVEWLYSNTLSLNTQFFVQGSPFRNTGIRAIDEVATILSFGGRYRINPEKSLEFSFSEDTNTAGAPDFMVGFGYRYKF